MSNPPPPSPKLPSPKMPPQKEVKKIDPTHCILHKGPLEEEIYTCTKCGAKMCRSCALKRKQEQNKPFCPKCTGFLFVK